MREKKIKHKKFGGVTIEVFDDMLNASQIISYYNEREPKKKKHIKSYLDRKKTTSFMVKLNKYTYDDLVITDDNHKRNVYLHKVMFTNFIEWIGDPQITAWAVDFAGRIINIPESSDHRLMLEAIKSKPDASISLFWEETQFIKKLCADGGHVSDVDYLGLIEDIYSLNAHYIALNLSDDDRKMLLSNWVYGFWIIKKY